MQLNPAGFNKLLNNLGEWFAWRQSFACPCVNPNSGAPLAGCPHCFGKGRAWVATPTRARAGVASSSTQLKWAQMGMWVSGDMVLSIPEDSPLYDISQFDRVAPETNAQDFSMPLVRGATKERVNGPVLSVSRVFWYDGQDTVEGGIPIVAADGTLTWPNGGEPPQGKTYSISGQRTSEYFCFGAFANDRFKHAGARLPKLMVLRKFDLFGRNGPN